MSRKKDNPLEFFETPIGLTRALVQRLHLTGPIIEPCVGDGAIARELEKLHLKVITNDIDPERPADFTLDATQQASWDLMPSCSWAVTNPPFSKALDILQLAFKKAEVGVAMMLRLSFLEPCEPRARWLHAHPPNRVIVLPRVSFDGKVNDQVTCCWLVWFRRPADHPTAVPVQVVLREWL
jgi:hypothetical protein